MTGRATNFAEGFLAEVQEITTRIDAEAVERVASLLSNVPQTERGAKQPA